MAREEIIIVIFGLLLTAYLWLCDKADETKNKE